MSLLWGKLLCLRHERSLLRVQLGLLLLLRRRRWRRGSLLGLSLRLGRSLWRGLSRRRLSLCLRRRGLVRLRGRLGLSPKELRIGCKVHVRPWLRSRGLLGLPFEGGVTLSLIHISEPTRPY